MNDDQFETLLRDTFRAHENLADPERARALALSASAPRPRWTMVLSAAAAVVLIVGTLAYAVGRDGTQNESLPMATTSPTPTTSDPDGSQPTDADYRAMAAVASERTLAKTPVPDGAIRLEDQPPGWPKDYGMSLGPSDQGLTRTAWWSVPMSTEALADFLSSHEPEGLAHNPDEDVITCGNDSGICDTTFYPTRQIRPEAYSEPTLLVQFTAAGDRSVMRADTFTFARPVRSPEGFIDGPVTSVGIDRVVRGSGLHNVREPRVEIIDPDQINRLVEAVNGLYGHYGFSASCPYPGDPRPSLSLSFHTASGVVRVHGNLVCWEGLTVTRDGERIAPELDPEDIEEIVDQVLNKKS